MVLRKLPGVSASGMGLRLSQKFVFLLFLSGLVTLCFGALFFLPDSVRLKRIFLSKNENPAVTVGSDNELSKKMPGDPEHQRAGLKGAEGANVKLKVSRKPSVTHGARTVERSVGSRAQDEWSPARAQEPAARDERVTSAAHNGDRGSPYSYEAFKSVCWNQLWGRTRELHRIPRRFSGGRKSKRWDDLLSMEAHFCHISLVNYDMPSHISGINVEIMTYCHNFEIKSRNYHKSKKYIRQNIIIMRFKSEFWY